MHCENTLGKWLVVAEDDPLAIAIAYSFATPTEATVGDVADHVFGRGQAGPGISSGSNCNDIGSGTFRLPINSQLHRNVEGWGRPGADP